MTGIRKLRWLAAIPALMILFASATVAQGGLRWIGIDPTVMIEDSQVDIAVFWPEQDTCSIDGPIEIGLLYPVGVSDVRLVSESQEEFDCVGPGGGAVRLTTATELQEGSDSRRKRDKVVVTGLLRSSEKMRVRLEASLDGEIIRECRGKSNRLITCRPFELDDEGRVDNDSRATGIAKTRTTDDLLRTRGALTGRQQPGLLASGRLYRAGTLTPKESVDFGVRLPQIMKKPESPDEVPKLFSRE